MEHRPPVPLIPPTAVDEGALRAALDEPAGPDLVSPAAELTGIHLVGDDAVLELVLPRDALDALELKVGGRYDLSENLDGDGVHVPVILSSSLALTAPEINDFIGIADMALRFRGSVSLRVDEHADEHPWSVVATVDGDPGVFTAWGDTPREALDKAVHYRWDDTPLGGPAPEPIGGWPVRNGDPS